MLISLFITCKLVLSSTTLFIFLTLAEIIIDITNIIVKIIIVYNDLSILENLTLIDILLIIGTNKFITRIEVNTPSGNGVKNLNVTVKSPNNNPYIFCPKSVIGLVTGSVAMKMAPKNKPPLNI